MTASASGLEMRSILSTVVHDAGNCCAMHELLIAVVVGIHALPKGTQRNGKAATALWIRAGPHAGQ